MFALSACHWLPCEWHTLIVYQLAEKEVAFVNAYDAHKQTL